MEKENENEKEKGGRGRKEKENGERESTCTMICPRESKASGSPSTADRFSVLASVAAHGLSMWLSMWLFNVAFQCGFSMGLFNGAFQWGFQCHVCQDWTNKEEGERERGRGRGGQQKEQERGVGKQERGASSENEWKELHTCPRREDSLRSDCTGGRQQSPATFTVSRFYGAGSNRLGFASLSAAAAAVCQL